MEPNTELTTTPADQWDAMAGNAERLLASWNTSPAPPDPDDGVVVTIYTDPDESVGIGSQQINVIIPADLWFSLSAGERDEMTADILNAIGPWMDDKARVRVDAGSDLV